MPARIVVYFGIDQADSLFRTRGSLNVSDARWASIRSRGAHNATCATKVATLQIAARGFAFHALTGSAVLPARDRAQSVTSPSTCTTNESIGPSCCVILRGIASPALSMRLVAGMRHSQTSARSLGTGACLRSLPWSPLIRAATPPRAVAVGVTQEKMARATLQRPVHRSRVQALL